MKLFLMLSLVNCQYPFNSYLDFSYSDKYPDDTHDPEILYINNIEPSPSPLPKDKLKLNINDLMHESLLNTLESVSSMLSFDAIWQPNEKAEQNKKTNSKNKEDNLVNINDYDLNQRIHDYESNNHQLNERIHHLEHEIQSMNNTFTYVEYTLEIINNQLCMLFFISFLIWLCALCHSNKQKKNAVTVINAEPIKIDVEK